MPLVSISIPAFNGERFIADTIKSALKQDYHNLEIIVSYDLSTDKTPEIIKSFERYGIKFISQAKHLGIYAHYNAVIRASNGKYVCKLDQDDLIAPEYISSMVEVMEANPEVCFAHCACRLIDVDGRFLGYERSLNGSFIRDGLQEWSRYVYGPRAINIVLLRRSSFDSVGSYDEAFKLSADWKMHRELLKIGKAFYHDKVLATYRVHSIGKEGWRLEFAKENIIHLDEIEKDWPDGISGKKNLI